MTLSLRSVRTALSGPTASVAVRMAHRLHMNKIVIRTCKSYGRKSLAKLPEIYTQAFSYREEFENWCLDDPEAALRRVDGERERNVLEVLREHNHHGHSSESAQEFRLVVVGSS